MLAFMHKVHRVTMDIMSCLAIGLGLPEDFYVKVGLMCPFICLAVNIQQSILRTYDESQMHFAFSPVKHLLHM